MELLLQAARIRVINSIASKRYKIIKHHNYSDFMPEKISKTSISIHGMHCASCAITIEGALGRVKGVKKADVNYGTEKAIVEYDSSLAEPEQFAKAIKDLGYEAFVQEAASGQKSEPAGHHHEGMEVPVTDREKELRQKEISELKLKFAAGTILSFLSLSSGIFLGE